MLTIVTLNTWKCAGDYFLRMRLMAEGLAALSPDIVLLQEVFASACGGIDTGQSLRERLRLTCFSEPARRKPRPLCGAEIDSTSGLTVLTGLPVLDSRRLGLPSDPADGDRIAQIVTVQWAGRPLTVVNTHLSHLDGADALRERQLATIARALPAGRAAVLGGDFNAEPDSAPLRWLREDSGLQVADACAGDPAATVTGDDRRTFGTRRIDYVFAVAPPGVRPLEFAVGKRVLDQPDPATGALPSDHAGVCAVLR